MRISFFWKMFQCVRLISLRVDIVLNNLRIERLKIIETVLAFNFELNSKVAQFLFFFIRCKRIFYRKEVEYFHLVEKRKLLFIIDFAR